MVATCEVAALAREAARAQGLPGARIATVEHPIGGVSNAQRLARAETLVDTVLALLVPQHI